MDDTQARPAEDDEPSTPPGDDAADPAAPRSAAAAAVFGGSDDPWDADESMLSWKLFAGVFAVLLLLGVVTYQVFNRSSGTDAAGKGSGGGAKPTVPADAAVRDDFQRESPQGLGVTQTGQTWEIASGTWGTRDGAAYLVAPNQDGAKRSLAVVDLGAANGSVSATMTAPDAGWSLVFRYKGPYNYWVLSAQKKFGTLNLQKVNNGQVVAAGKSDLVKLEDGAEISVSFVDGQIDVSVGGKGVLSLKDGFNKDATKIGLAFFGTEESDVARWSSFVGTRSSGGGAGAGGGAAGAR